MRKGGGFIILFDKLFKREKKLSKALLFTQKKHKKNNFVMIDFFCIIKLSTISWMKQDIMDIVMMTCVEFKNPLYLSFTSIKHRSSILYTILSILMWLFCWPTAFHTKSRIVWVMGRERKIIFFDSFYMPWKVVSFSLSMTSSSSQQWEPHMFSW